MINIDFDKSGGIIPVIAQDWETGEVLMLAYMNKEAWEKTQSTGKAHYFSRSRNKLWLKGESSGHVQLVKEILIDCDNDAVLLKINQIGKAACHTGYNSCFYRKIVNGEEKITKDKKIFDPEKVYKKE
ncbi:phosphoribosyl-AMP cyclohydrolase [Candidatus Poribacteria bacterium]|nr:phosphoribosyl-AMP cyclohydrolase [Candidatus Poribacteria bacterium]